MQGKGNSSTLLVGMQTGEATVENNMEFPQKTKKKSVGNSQLFRGFVLMKGN